METGTKNRTRSKPRMFCKEDLEKIKFRSAFPKRVGQQILSRESIDYLRTSEHLRILISKILMFGCCKLSLYANVSCDEHAIYFL